jgi:hypothetical protein
MPSRGVESPLCHNEHMPNKTRIAIDFPSQAAATAWFEEIKSAGHLPERAGLFHQDGLDTQASAGGITKGHTLIVKSIHDRSVLTRVDGDARPADAVAGRG